MDVGAAAARRLPIDTARRRRSAAPPTWRAASSKTLLHDAGYLHAQVDPARASSSTTRSGRLLVFAIEPGPRTNVGAIDVDGDAERARAASC